VTPTDSTRASPGHCNTGLFTQQDMQQLPSQSSLTVVLAGVSPASALGWLQSTLSMCLQHYTSSIEACQVPHLPSLWHIQLSRVRLPWVSGLVAGDNSRLYGNHTHWQTTQASTTGNLHACAGGRQGTGAEAQPCTCREVPRHV
jgi:hypothetical protein